MALSEAALFPVALFLLGVVVGIAITLLLLSMGAPDRREGAPDETSRGSFAWNVISALGQGVTVANEEGRFEYVNPAFARMAGRTQEELTGQRPQDVTHPDDVPALEQADRQRRDKHTTTYETRLLRPDGSVRRVLVTGVPRQLDGQFGGSFAIITDITQRKDLEDAYRALVENSLQGLLLIQEDGPIFANAAAEKISGYTAEEFTGMSLEQFLELVHPADREMAQARLSGRLAGEAHPERTTVRLVRKDGAIRWIETLASPIQYRGAPAVQVAYRDVTEEKQTEKRFRQEKQFSESLIASLPGIFYLLDAEGHFVRWNNQIEHVLGYSGEELAEIYPLDLVPKEEREKADRHLRRAFTEGQTAAELNIMSSDGEKIPYFFSGKRVEIGGAPYLVGTGVDISERRQRERELEAFVTVAQALRAANARHEILPIVLDQTLKLLGAQGTMFVSHPDEEHKEVELARGDWQSLSGQSLPPEVGFEDFDPEDGHLYIRDDARDALQWPGAERLRDLHAVAGVPLTNGDHVLGVLWAGRRQPFTAAEGRSLMAVADIAASALDRAHLLATMEEQVAERTRELATANERLREVDRLKSKLMDDVSHELRTPMTTIGLYLNLLEQGKGERHDHYIHVLRTQTERLNQVLESILQFTRLEAMAAGTLQDPVDVNDVVQKAVAKLQNEADAGDLDLCYTPAEGMPAVRGVPQLLTHAVTHLLDNAIRYTPDGAVTVRTRADKAAGMVCIEVEDTGIGIGEEELPHVFERFYRGRQVSQLTTPGAGLGLSLAQQIAVRHGGEIELESTVEEGTAVRLWLPAAGPT